MARGRGIRRRIFLILSVCVCVILPPQQVCVILDKLDKIQAEGVTEELMAMQPNPVTKDVAAKLIKALAHG